MSLFYKILNLFRVEREDKVLPVKDLKKLSIPTSKKDKRDYKIPYKVSKVKGLDVDFRPFLSPVRNQLHSNSCVGQGVSAADEYWKNKKTGEKWDLSDCQLWYDSKKVRGWENKNEGCYIRDALKIAQKKGITLEVLHPFKISNWYKNPGKIARMFQSVSKIGRYYQCMNQKEIDLTLSKGIPLVIGMKLYSNFYDFKGNFYNSVSGSFIGNHCMLLCGCIEDYYVIRNSWGTGWKDKGYFYIKKSLLVKLSRDIYAVEKP